MLKKQLIFFLILGIFAVLVDYITYKSLLYFLRNEEISNGNLEDFSKGIGFLSGTLFAYFANKYITFKSQKYKGRALLRFMLLYSTTLFINVYSNASSISLLNFISKNDTSIVRIDISAGDIYLLAFLFATAVSATLNFIGMKWFVFYNIKK